MNAQRAKEIADSPVMANVTYNDTPIYIQHVNVATETARIYPLEQPEKELEVPLNSLTEQ